LQHYYNGESSVLLPWVISGGQPLGFLIEGYCDRASDTNNGTNFYAKMLAHRDMFLRLAKVDIP